MNQEKTGKFISELRKGKNMTQRELADKIGVTDRAISKWENGRGMPDLSLMEPLCNELGISVNELLSGEKIEPKDYREKSEENILNTIEYTEKKIKKNSNIFKIIIASVIVLTVSLILLFITDVQRMNQNKPVVFSTWGYKYAPLIDTLDESGIKTAIKEYLTEHGDSEPKHHSGEKTFVSFKVYLTERKKPEPDSQDFVYAWVQTAKYYLENGELKQDSGFSEPYKFKIEKIDGEFTVTDSRTPRDGSYYADDMKNIFPANVRTDMDGVYTDGTTELLQADIEEKAKLYFYK